MSNGVNGFYNGSIEKINVRRTGPPIKIFQNDCPIITFEGVGDLNSVPNMNLGFTEVFFPGWLGLVDSDAGGSGNFENEPSPSTTAFWLDGPFKEILFNQPISSLSLFYSSRFPVTLQAFNSNGNLVDTTIGPPNVIGEVFDVWSNLSVEAGSNLITRVRYTGVANQTGIDNVEVCQVPLIITCPQDITLRNDPGQCGARVEFPPPDVTGGVPPYMVECTFESGDFFQLGTTTVECTASDSAGNAATCSFKVTVNDTEPPSITCPSDITVSNDPGQCGARVTYPAPTVSDNCPGATVECTPVSGSVFPVGTTTVTCTARDGAGNTSTCSFDVTVNDTEPPSITCPSDITVSNDPGQCGARVTYPAPTVSDNCPGATVECTPVSGSVFPVGTTTVTCTAGDGAGNTSTCSFDVTVNDTEPPSITCPPDMTVSNDPGQCGARVTYPAPTVSDNCPGATVECTPASGSFFPVGTTTVTCRATDAADNTAECTFNVTVRETEGNVVLGNIQIQTLIESEFKLPSYAADIKQIRKNVHLTQCKVLPITNVNNMASLFVEGYIHKNIQYVEGCEGYVRDYSVNVPFNCYNRVQLARPILFPFGQYSMKNNDLETRGLAEDGQGADRCTFGSSTFEIKNEPIHCKLVASSVNQWDIIRNFDSCGRFDTVSEKEDISLTVRLTQTGSGCEPS